MKDFFKGIYTMQELHQEYRRLIKENHPDLGGDEETMKAINNQYEKAVEYIRKHGEHAEQKKAAAEVPAEFMGAVNAVVNCPGIILELVGCWLWATGDTYSNREALKAAGYHYASRKKAWYWHTAEDGYTGHTKRSLNWIKSKYGAERLTAEESDPRLQIATA